MQELISSCFNFISMEHWPREDAILSNIDYPPFKRSLSYTPIPIYIHFWSRLSKSTSEHLPKRVISALSYVGVVMHVWIPSCSTCRIYSYYGVGFCISRATKPDAVTPPIVPKPVPQPTREDSSSVGRTVVPEAQKGVSFGIDEGIYWWSTNPKSKNLNFGARNLLEPRDSLRWRAYSLRETPCSKSCVGSGTQVKGHKELAQALCSILYSLMTESGFYFTHFDS